VLIHIAMTDSSSKVLVVLHLPLLMLVPAVSDLVHDIGVGSDVQDHG